MSILKNNLTKLFLALGIGFIILVGCVLYFGYRGVIHPLEKNGDRVSFKVEKNENIDRLVDELYDNGKIARKNLLKWYLDKKFSGIDIKPGEYSFDGNIHINNFVRYIESGITDDRPVSLTIPEGYDIEQIADLLNKKGIIDRKSFLESLKNYKYPAFAKIDKGRRYVLEGYLFPDTYQFLKGSSGNFIIETMLDRFSDVMSEVEKKYNKKFTNDEIDKIVTMASIVEKEVKRPDERGKAASVFYNRLEKHMKLQSCATVLYSLNKHKDKLYYKDLTVKSPYNTYIVDGMPKGPISNPGKGCIEAAIKPDKTNYIYFVSKNNGSHFFTDDIKKFSEVKEITQEN